MKLLKHFEDKIVIQKGKTRRRNIIFSSSVTVEDVRKCNVEIKARGVALALRSQILKTQKTLFSQQPSLYVALIFGG